MEQREKILLGALILFGVGVLAWYVVMPAWDDYQSWEQEIEQNVSEVQNAQREGARLDELFERQRELEVELQRIQQQLPVAGEFFQLMRQLEQEAQEAGIEEEKIRQFSHAGEADGDLVDEMFINANFDDLTMEQLVNLLWRFENFERIIDIRSFSISPNTTDDQQFYDLDLSIVVYIMSEDEDLEEV